MDSDALAAEEIISGTVGHGVSASSGEALAVNISATVGHGASASSVNPRYRFVLPTIF